MKKLFVIAAFAAACLSASAQDLKFAHVNMSELIQLMPEMDQARATSDAAAAEAQETFQSMVEEYNSKLQAYEQKQATWTPAVKESKERELMEVQNRVQEFQQAIQQDLQQQQQELMAPIQQKALDTVNQLAKDAGYIYVFDVNSVLYVDKAKSTDLTPAARKLLNIPEGRTLEALYKELQEKAQAAQATQPAQ